MCYNFNMKILVINNMLEEKHLGLIKKTAESLGHEVHFFKNEGESHRVILMQILSMALRLQS